ncbi:MAG: tetratricopeptide repeat protein [Cyanobacteria bacterium J06631_12]
MNPVPETASERTSTETFTAAIRNYHHQVTALTSPSAQNRCVWTHEADILALLRQRDRIQFFIDQSAKQPDIYKVEPTLLVQLSNDDATVGKWSKQFTKIDTFSDWRKSLNPPAHHWWWAASSEPIKPWVEWFLGGLTIALITLCLALARDISTRFFTGAPGIWSSIGAIAPAAIALFATGGALTKVGKQLIDTLLSKHPKAARRTPWIKFGLVAGLTALFFIAHFQGLPAAANRYHETGKQQYFNEGRIASAQGSFKRALQLNPNFPEANHNLALTYEDLRDFDSAEAEYVKAVNAGFLRSVNNLARLQIVEEEDYESAAVLLLTALQNEERDREDANLEYGLRKNLGWAWLNQDRLLKAQGELIKANRIEASLPEPRPDAYCLLAQVLEKQEKPTEARAEWETCRQKIARPEDDVWSAMADKALNNRLSDRTTDATTSTGNLDTQPSETPSSQTPSSQTPSSTEKE